MTPEQEQHLYDIKELFVGMVDKKYRRGQAEHGGDLFAKNEIDLLDMAIEETIDQFVYLITARNKLLERTK